MVRRIVDRGSGLRGVEVHFNAGEERRAGAAMPAWKNRRIGKQNESGGISERETEVGIVNVFGFHVFGDLVADGAADVRIDVLDFVGLGAGQVKGSDGGVDGKKLLAIDEVLAVVAEENGAAAFEVVDAPLFGAVGLRDENVAVLIEILAGDAQDFPFFVGKAACAA